VGGLEARAEAEARAVMAGRWAPVERAVGWGSCEGQPAHASDIAVSKPHRRKLGSSARFELLTPPSAQASTPPDYWFAGSAAAMENPRAEDVLGKRIVPQV
jgi:hypothetical protein